VTKEEEMARVFVQYDGSGKIMAVVTVQESSASGPPVVLADPSHGVLELPNDPSLDPEQLSQTHSVDVAVGKLVRAADRGGRPRASRSQPK
jgi:hypothetical protein